MEIHDGFHDNRLRRCLVNQGCGGQLSLGFRKQLGSHANAASFPPSLGRQEWFQRGLRRVPGFTWRSPPAKLPRPYPKFRSPNSRSTGVPSGPVRHGAKSGVVEPILLLERLWSEATRQRLFFKPNQATQKQWESRRAARRSVRVIASQTPPLSLRQATAPSRRPGRSRKRSSRCRT